MKIDRSLDVIKNSFGVTLLVYLQHANVESIKFDAFHCKCAIIRKIMSDTKDLIVKYFLATIKCFPTDAYETCWNNNFEFQKPSGKII